MKSRPLALADRSTFIDPPFAVPPDIVLDIPAPPSVNASRRIDYAGRHEIDKWKKQAGLRLLVNNQLRRARAVLGDKPAERFELHLTFNETLCRCDLDNYLKSAIDYLVTTARLIVDDKPPHLRKIVAEWGEAPNGCRIVIKPIEGGA